MEGKQNITDNHPQKELNNEDLRQLLETNIALSQDILKTAVYIKKYIIWQKVLFFLKLIIILVPIILAVIYLPPFFQKNYQSFLEALEALKIIQTKAALFR